MTNENVKTKKDETQLCADLKGFFICCFFNSKHETIIHTETRRAQRKTTKNIYVCLKAPLPQN